MQFRNPKVTSTHQLFDGSLHAAGWLLHLQGLGALPLKPVATLAEKTKSAYLNPCPFSLFRAWQASRSWHGFAVSSVGEDTKILLLLSGSHLFPVLHLFPSSSHKFDVAALEQTVCSSQGLPGRKSWVFQQLGVSGSAGRGKKPLAQEPQNTVTAFLPQSASLKKDFAWLGKAIFEDSGEEIMWKLEYISSLEAVLWYTMWFTNWFHATATSGPGRMPW